MKVRIDWDVYGFYVCGEFVVFFVGFVCLMEC